MKAVILAGGHGKRVGNITLESPKPLIKVAGKPLIQYVLDVLPSEIDHCIIVLGHLGEKIKQELGDVYGKLSIQYVQQKKIGTGGALLSARHILAEEERFFVIGSDDIFGPNELQKLICNSASYGVHYGIPSKISSRGVLFDENDMLIGFKTDYKSNDARYFGVGAYVLPATALDTKMHMLPNNEYSIPHSLPKMPFPVRVRIIHRWFPVNNQEELERVEKKIYA